MLYDLQKVCVDHERGVYGLDLPRWIMTLGKSPLKAPVARAARCADVQAPGRRRQAAARCAAGRRVRARLDSLLQSAIHRTEQHLRARFKPKIEAALDQVQLYPKNVPERVASLKLVDELLDRVAKRGFLAMGDFRDALSRNNLKLPDLASAEQFVWGDQLLRADAQLADTMDGVYRRGEIYLRWPQRLSSLAFGLPAGRFFSRYIAMPFGGAFLVVEFMQHLVNLWRAHVLDLEEVSLDFWWRWLSVGLLGSFLLGLLHNARFRQACAAGFRAAGRGLYLALIRWPSRLLHLEWVKSLLNSRVYAWAVRYGVKPAIVTACGLLLARVALHRWPQGSSCLWTFVAIDLLLNSRLGRNVDELVTDLATQTWHRFRIHVIASVLRFINDVFNTFLQGLERLLYTVDEWLRFRAGEGRLATAVKFVLSIAWSFIHYVVRMCVNLLVEPQLNPIKHFPVVTVSHKVIGPFLFPILMTLLTGPLGLAWRGWCRS